MVGLPWRTYASFVLMGEMAYPGGRVLSNTAIKMVGASGAGLFASPPPLSAFVLGEEALGERPNLLVVLGTPTIVVGLVLVLVSRASINPVGTVVSSNTAWATCWRLPKPPASAPGTSSAGTWSPGWRRLR